MRACFLALVATVLTSLADDDEPVSPPDDQEVYRKASAQAGKGADAHVRLAVWCEAHGLTKEYDQELAEALRLNPNHAGARGLQGMVKVGGKWFKPADVPEQAPVKPALAGRLVAYDEKRAGAGDTAKDHMTLADWCLSQGLSDEAHLHLSTALRRDPTQADVKRKLGYKLRQSHWVNDLEEAQAKRRHVEAKDANLVWQGKIVQLEHARANPKTRAAADAELANVHDPHAAPSIWSVFVHERQFSLAAQLLSQIEGPEATSRLALLALGADLYRVHKKNVVLEGKAARCSEAIEALGYRDPREYVGPLIDYLRPAPKVEVRPINGPGIPGAIFVDGELKGEFSVISWPEFKIRTSPPIVVAVPVNIGGAPSTLSLHGSGKGAVAAGAPGAHVSYSAPDPAVAQAFAHAMMNPAAAPQIFSQFSAPAYHAPPPVVYDVQDPKKKGSLPASRPVVTTAKNVDQVDLDYERYVQSVDNQLQVTASQYQFFSDRIAKQRAVAHELLKTLTGRDLPLDQQAWSIWWKGWSATESGGNGAPVPPAVPVNLAQAIAPAPSAASAAKLPPAPVKKEKLHRSRLAEGTLVWTAHGQRPVENLRLGDRILTQEPRTGALSYAPIVDKTQLASDDLLQLSFEGGGALSVTPMEHVWEAGRSWVSACTLKPGDEVRLLGAKVRLAEIKSLDPRPTFNIFLLDANGIFAGERAALVHDNSIVRPPSHPFDDVIDPNPIPPPAAARKKS